MTENKKNHNPNKKKKYTGKKKFTHNKNRRPKALSPSKVAQKYDNLLDQYLTARKKFYEYYGRSKGKQLEKIKRNYDTALKNLRSFGDKLNDWQQEILDKKVNGLACDRQFSMTHNLEPAGDAVSFVGEFEDPHLLPTQKSEDWAADTEESNGTIEDYEKYKASR